VRGIVVPVDIEDMKQVTDDVLRFAKAVQYHLISGKVMDEKTADAMHELTESVIYRLQHPKG
jgi:hypothetical protein